jgi:hypothetical protein
MKTHRILASLFVSVILSAGLTAQSADDVINDYLSAIGGKKKLNKITSLQTKSQIVSDMFEAEAVTTILNGKGYKMDMDVMGNQFTTCYTDKEGWRTDPMAGSIVQMPDDTYKLAKGAIYISGPFEKYKDLGYSSEMVGRADVNGVNTYQIRFTVDGTDLSTDHFFDPDTHLLIRTITVVVEQGSEMEVVNDYKDYKEVDGGIKLAHIQDIDYAGQMSMTITISTAEVNIPVDPSIFVNE